MNVDMPVITGYELCADRPDDATELTGLIAAQEEYLGARTTTSPALVATLLKNEGMRYIQVRVPGSGLLAAGAIFENPPPHVASYTRVWVHPDHMGRGIGSALTTWSIATARADLQRAPVGTRVVNGCMQSHVKKVAEDALEAHGYSVVRYFLEMTIGLTETVEPAAFPDAVTVRTMTDLDRIEPLADVQHEAFRDHFGWVERPQESRYLEWTEWRESDLWENELVWLVEADGQVVAMLTALDAHGTSTDTGYVAVLGVRKEWRGRGIARSLLATAFDEFDRRKKSSVVLHVDADSLTGATQLYERAGMRTTDRATRYEIEIRPGKDPLVR